MNMAIVRARTALLAAAGGAVLMLGACSDSYEAQSQGNVTVDAAKPANAGEQPAVVQYEYPKLERRAPDPDAVQRRLQARAAAGSTGSAGFVSFQDADGNPISPPPGAAMPEVQSGPRTFTVRREKNAEGGEQIMVIGDFSVSIQEEIHPDGSVTHTETQNNTVHQVIRGTEYLEATTESGEGEVAP